MRLACLVAALCAFLLLPGLHVLVHAREAAQLEAAQALAAVRALQHARFHHGDLESATPDHDHESDAPRPHQHSHRDSDGHGRGAAEHLATAITLSAALPLFPPAAVHSQLVPPWLLDRLPTRLRVRSHSCRAPPIG